MPSDSTRVEIKLVFLSLTVYLPMAVISGLGVLMALIFLAFSIIFREKRSDQYFYGIVTTSLVQFDFFLISSTHKNCRIRLTIYRATTTPKVVCTNPIIELHFILNQRQRLFGKIK